MRNRRRPADRAASALAAGLPPLRYCPVSVTTAPSCPAFAALSLSELRDVVVVVHGLEIAHSDTYRNNMMWRHDVAS